MPARSDSAIWSGLFTISPDSGQTLQAQIRQAIVAAILFGFPILSVLFHLRALPLRAILVSFLLQGAKLRLQLLALLALQAL